jgi:LysR family hydrogen peroxide-inducible transcriptional activator
MEMHQLRYFQAVARTGNFSRAARECHVSQPSLSQQILKLEDELGETLFFRNQQGATMTPAGLLFRPFADRILADAEEARRRVSEVGPVVRGKLVLGALPTIAPFMVPELVTSFMAQYPEAEVTVQEDVTLRLVAGIEAGEIDVALLSLPVATGTLEKLELMEEPLLLALPSGHHRAADETVRMEEVTGEKFILMQEGHCLTGQILDFCHAKGDFSPKISCRSAQIQTLLALVAAGLGVSIVPRMAAVATDGVVFKEFVSKRPSRKIGFVWKRNRLLPLVAQAFVNSAKGNTPREVH